MNDAYKNGWHAHRLGIVSDENPYDDTKQLYSFNQWVSGWHARYDAVKHGHSLEHDMEVGWP